MRHNKIRDLEAELMREVCNDVRIEPELLPLNNEQLVRGNTAQKARLDVSGNGVWGPQERSFLDIRIMHPNSPSYRDKDIDQVYRQHEREKKRTYNLQRAHNPSRERFLYSHCDVHIRWYGC